MALKYVTRKYFQGKIVAYFKKNNKVLRYKLHKIEEVNLDRKLRVKSTYTLSDPDWLNEQIDDLEEKVDNAISEILYTNPDALIDGKAIDEYFANLERMHEKSSQDKEEGQLLADFQRYNEKKGEEKHREDIKNGESRKSHPSMKDYISAANAIADYEYDIKTRLYLSDVTEELISDFKDWLAEEHIDTKEHKYRCKGHMVNKTINKRLESLAAFIRAFYDNEDVAKMIMGMRFPGRGKGKVIVLSLDEVKELYYRELKNLSHNKVRDYFVFLCQTGLRYSDFLLLSEKNFLKQRDGSYLLSYVSHKTRVEVSFELTSKAQEIAERYNFTFTGYTNQAFNRTLSDMLENEELYGDEIASIQYRLGKVEEAKVMRREKISAHSARRTFISCLISKGVSPYQVMNMSGHTQLSTMDIYVEKFSPEVQKATKKIEI